MPRYAPNPAGNNLSNEIRKDETHPRQHALAMASATHLKNMGHMDEETCDAIHKKCSKALGKKRNKPHQAQLTEQRPDLLEQPAFGSFAPRG